MYGIAELCGRSCCLNELWYQRNEADKCNLSLSKSALVCLGQLSRLPSGPVADDWSEAQVWQKHGCVWSAGRGRLVAFGGSGARQGRFCMCLLWQQFCCEKLPSASLPGFAVYQGVLRATHPVTSAALLAGNCVWTNCANLLGGIQSLQERKCQLRGQHELLGCYQTSSSMLIWVRSVCISQWNKMIIL